MQAVTKYPCVVATCADINKMQYGWRGGDARFLHTCLPLEALRNQFCLIRSLHLWDLSLFRRVGTGDVKRRSGVQVPSSHRSISKQTGLKVRTTYFAPKVATAVSIYMEYCNMDSIRPCTSPCKSLRQSLYNATQMQHESQELACEPSRAFSFTTSVASANSQPALARFRVLFAGG